MNKSYITALASTTLVGACSTYSPPQAPYTPNTPKSERSAPQKDLFPGVVPGKLTFISPEQARKNNVAHMVIRYHKRIVGICHFGRVKIPIDGKEETFIGTAGHCVDPGSYTDAVTGRVNNNIDSILARSLTRLLPPGSGIDFVTTDNPKTLERSTLSGNTLHQATVEMSGCLPHGNGTNTSTCFHFKGMSYMRGGAAGKATVFFDRIDYIELLKRANRTCEEAYISGVSGNYFTDQDGKMVGFTSTALNACSSIHQETVLNNLGDPLRINAFPVSFEPIRNHRNDGKSTVILN